MLNYVNHITLSLTSNFILLQTKAYKSPGTNLADKENWLLTKVLYLSHLRNFIRLQTRFLLTMINCLVADKVDSIAVTRDFYLVADKVFPPALSKENNRCRVSDWGWVTVYLASHLDNNPSISIVYILSVHVP